MGIAYGYAISVPVGLGVGALLFSIATFALLRWAAVVEVTADGLRAGRARLPASAIGAVTPLDAGAARNARGTEADSRAFVLLRGWIATAVTVEVDDSLDPTPYWYVSTRRRDQLATALEECAGSS